MIRPWQVGLFILVVIASALATLPLALVIQPASGEGWRVRAVEGTVWSGRLSGLGIGAVALGDAAVEADLSAVPLGRLGARVNLASTQAQGSLRYARGLDGSRTLQTEQLDLIDLRPDPRLEPFDVRAQALRLRFDAQRCVTAAGVLSTNALERNAARWGVTGANLVTDIRCEGRDAVAALAPPDGGPAFIEVRLSPDGRGSVRLSAVLAALWAPETPPSSTSDQPSSGEFTWAPF
jgi:hypothetical protein